MKLLVWNSVMPSCRFFKKKFHKKENSAGNGKLKVPFVHFAPFNLSYSVF